MTTPDNIGTISGIVGLAGGLGGFILPIMFGYLLDLTGVRSSAFMLLYGVVWVSLIWMYWTEVRQTEVMGENALPAPSASLSSTELDFSSPAHRNWPGLSVFTKELPWPRSKTGSQKIRPSGVNKAVRWPGAPAASPPSHSSFRLPPGSS